MSRKKKLFLLIITLGFSLSLILGCVLYQYRPILERTTGSNGAPGHESWVDVQNPILLDQYMEVPILIYHCIEDRPKQGAGDGGMYVSAKKFEQQIKYLSEEGYNTVFVKDLGGPLPPKPIAITFDDGYQNNYTLALPILEKYQAKATIFMVGSAADKAIPGRLSWSDLRYMRETGLVDVQSHTYALHDSVMTTDYLGKQKEGESEEAYIERIKADIAKQDEVFLRELGYTPVAIAYPNGYYNELLNDIYLDHGYTISCTTEVAAAVPSLSLSLLPRVPVFGFSKFQKLIHKYG